MARRLKSMVEIILDADRQRQAMQARELRLMNERAARGLLDNAAVLTAGAVRNAVGGLLPLMGEQRQRRAKRR